MHLSVYSILISLIVATILVGILQLFIVRTKAYGVFRIDFIAAFAVIVMLRLLLPMEYIDTYTISSHKILPAIYGFLAHTRWNINGFKLTWFIILGVVWLLGAIVALTRLIWQAHHLDRTLGALNRINPRDLQLAPTVTVPRNVTIYHLPGVSSPFVSGLRHPKLILPSLDLDSSTLNHIMRHELQHIKNRDVLIKYLISVLVCVYWWFPPMYLFRRQANMIIDMRVDNQIVQHADKTEYFSYTQSLVDVTKQLKRVPNTPITPALSAALLPQFTMFERPTLAHRIKFLLTGRQVKHTNRILLALIVAVPLLATSIIFEPDSIDPADAKGTFEVDMQHSKIVQRGKKYYLRMNGHDMGEVQLPLKAPLNQLPVVKEH